VRLVDEPGRGRQRRGARCRRRGRDRLGDLPRRDSPQPRSLLPGHRRRARPRRGGPRRDLAAHRPRGGLVEQPARAGARPPLAGGARERPRVAPHGLVRLPAEARRRGGDRLRPLRRAGRAVRVVAQRVAPAPPTAPGAARCRPRRVSGGTRVLAVALAAVATTVAACGGKERAAKSGGRTVDVTLTEAGCEPARLELAAGPVTFNVANSGADEVTEFEILDGSRIVGEVENVASGLRRSFSMTLEPGRYVTYCPGGTSAERGTLVVTGKASRARAVSARVRASVAAYRGYVGRQTSLLVTRTRR